MYGAIEAGGSKFVCSIGNDANEILQQITFPTTTPEETMAQVIDFLDLLRKNFKQMGLAHSDRLM